MVGGVVSGHRCLDVIRAARESVATCIKLKESTRVSASCNGVPAREGRIVVEDGARSQASIQRGVNGVGRVANRHHHVAMGSTVEVRCCVVCRNHGTRNGNKAQSQ